jgi:hypothetical protein
MEKSKKAIGFRKILIAGERVPEIVRRELVAHQICTQI